MIVDLSTCLNSRQKVHTIYTEFVKVFYTVKPKILLCKFISLSAPISHESYLAPYLSNHSCSVSFDGCIFCSLSFSSAVPQGSTLGSLLFLFFINDLFFPSLLPYLTLFVLCWQPQAVFRYMVAYELCPPSVKSRHPDSLRFPNGAAKLSGFILYSSLWFWFHLTPL